MSQHSAVRACSGIVYVIEDPPSVDVPAAMDVRLPHKRARARRTGPTVEQLMDRFEKFGKEDAGYRRLTVAVRRAVNRLLPLLDKRALARYLDVEQATNARDVYSIDAVAQWAYSLGYRDGASPMPRVRVRKRALERLTRLRGAPPR